MESIVCQRQLGWPYFTHYTSFMLLMLRVFPNLFIHLSPLT
ncbi:hypothetical protein ADICYQ_3558 [Cyclobacterium qasimii M12-11B]|uniref:Uncharacterized protein n=1 Tax=Cyclobacterium qasimii M12-11B TaxID=641524 RepID=S7WLC7_9BACT|nr:hypothetical protein ADICYQ_3558 [Cyclobacterium qasimii M12-11B]